MQRMKMYRRVFCLTLFAVPLAATAQTYPVKPIRFIVPFPAGAGTDILARAIAQKLNEAWGQPVTIDNRPGASTIIGSEIVAKAPPDGYTIIMASNNHAVNPALFAKLPYDTVRDFAPVARVAILPLVLVVHPSVPAKNVKELVALARSKPGQLNYASTGNGSPPHLGGEVFKQLAKLDLVHVPYKGSVPALTDVVGGQVSLMFANTLSTLPQVRAGRLRALAVGTTQRIAAAPELPTVAEAGVPGFDVSVWAGILAPAATPRDVIVKLNREIARIAGLPDVRKKLAAEGAELMSSTPEEFAAFIGAEIERWGKVAKAANMRID